ncbi:Uncharacterised protein [Streptococcus pneumoniae]|nr:Uncharacterised protein [Streptococcus pneumoniae]CIW22060.1 Uncharacterised protein [Streptococcus pneumoniae]
MVMLTMNIYKMLPNSSQNRQINHLTIYTADTTTILQDFPTDDNFIT